MMIPYILKPDGTKENRPPANGKKFTLEEMQSAIGGGYVELVKFSHDIWVLVDEDGIQKGLPPNPYASQMLVHQIVGTVLVFPRNMMG